MPVKSCARQVPQRLPSGNRGTLSVTWPAYRALEPQPLLTARQGDGRRTYFAMRQANAPTDCSPTMPPCVSTGSPLTARAISASALAIAIPARRTTHAQRGTEVRPGRRARTIATGPDRYELEQEQGGIEAAVVAHDPVPKDGSVQDRAMNPLQLPPKNVNLCLDTSRESLAPRSTESWQVAHRMDHPATKRLSLRPFHNRLRPALLPPALPQPSP